VFVVAVLGGCCMRPNDQVNRRHPARAKPCRRGILLNAMLGPNPSRANGSQDISSARSGETQCESHRYGNLPPGACL